uniref:Uncharacterized protein n=1 Tax=Anguilla anguilla TaxID=7936 RepID=A0A0E9W5A4_ANGAN
MSLRLLLFSIKAYRYFHFHKIIFFEEFLITPKY